ncbi:vitamin K epoxide reductase family protein [Candidatus Woesearchaeota archaeon]|nr:vitamin K epoxide reductase family protein [Candidatus Woesearchaeota archaeon]
MAKKRLKQRISAQQRPLSAAILPHAKKEAGLATRNMFVKPELALPFVPEEKKIARNLRVILFLSIIGMITATYLTYNHFKSDAESFCSISQTINCDIVNKSTYAELFGIPVAILGFLAYLALAVCCLLLLKCAELEKLHRKLGSRHIHWMIFFIALSGFGFSTWLSYVEWKIIMTWCPLCVLSYLLLAVILVLSIMNIEFDHRCQKNKRSMGPHGTYLVKKTGKVCEFC